MRSTGVNFPGELVRRARSFTAACDRRDSSAPAAAATTQPNSTKAIVMTLQVTAETKTTSRRFIAEPCAISLAVAGKQRPFCLINKDVRGWSRCDIRLRRRIGRDDALTVSPRSSRLFNPGLPWNSAPSTNQAE